LKNGYLLLADTTYRTLNRRPDYTHLKHKTRKPCYRKDDRAMRPI